MRLRKMKRFNIFLFSVLGLISAILAVEIGRKIVSGTSLSVNEMQRYAWVWLTFFFGVAFINLVDGLVEKMGGRGSQS